MKKAYEARKQAKLQKKLAEKQQFKANKVADKTAELKAKTRKPEAIGLDYNRAAAEAGDKAYKAFVLGKEIEQVQLFMRRLNDEYATSVAVWKDDAKPTAVANEVKQATQQKDQPPVSNDFVAQGGEQFDQATIEANNEASQ